MAVIYLLISQRIHDVDIFIILIFTDEKTEAWRSKLCVLSPNN